MLFYLAVAAALGSILDGCLGIDFSMNGRVAIAWLLLADVLCLALAAVLWVFG